MTLNFQKNWEEIERAFNQVVSSKTGDEWLILDYEGPSNVIKVGETGDDGIDEFSTSFNSGRLQFGVISVRLDASVLPKIVLVHWQGEQVPSSRTASTTAHAHDVRRFLKTVHVVIYARNEIDVEPDVIRREVAKLPGTNAAAQTDSSYSTPTTVGSVYKPVKPHMDINLKEREKFWQQMNKEENERKETEKTQLADTIAQRLVKPEPAIPESQPSPNVPEPPTVVKSERVAVSEVKVHIEALPTQSPGKGLCALALWDYQATDDSEISFDPDNTISEIEQIDEGWWKGKCPNGHVGLFPSNYVRLV